MTGLIEKKRGTKERKSFLRREVEGTSASINDRGDVIKGPAPSKI